MIKYFRPKSEWVKCKINEAIMETTFEKAISSFGNDNIHDMMMKKFLDKVMTIEHNVHSDDKFIFTKTICSTRIFDGFIKDMATADIDEYVIAIKIIDTIRYADSKFVSEFYNILNTIDFGGANND